MYRVDLVIVKVSAPFCKIKINVRAKISFYELNTKYLWLVHIFIVAESKRCWPYNNNNNAKDIKIVWTHKQWQEKLRNATIQQW